VAKPTVLRQLIELIPAYLVPRATRWQQLDLAQLLRRDGTADGHFAFIDPPFQSWLSGFPA